MGCDVIVVLGDERKNDAHSERWDARVLTKVTSNREQDWTEVEWAEGLGHVSYKNVLVGNYAADLLVDGVVIVEIKVAPDYNPVDEAQLINELKATGIKVGLLINFGRTKVQFQRMVFETAAEGSRMKRR